MTKLRRRARQACRSCNARRVKCNVTEQQPCRNCATADMPCEVRESRRGKHARTLRKRELTRDPTALADLSRTRHHDAIVARPQSPNTLPTDSRPEYESSVTNPSVSDAGLSPPEKLKFLHSVPHAVRAENLIPELEVERRRTRIKRLKAEGVFSFPEKPAIENLLGAYFRWLHPCFPVVDELDTWTKYREGNLSPLLLQAILFMAVMHCDDDALPALGFGGRHMAKWVFYNRAKDIYDVEFEPKKLVVIQSLFLMSFWRAGLLLEKDARHWLDTRLERLRRRLWWSIYIREGRSEMRTATSNHWAMMTLNTPLIQPYIPTNKSREALGRIVHGGYLPSKSLSSIDRSQMKTDLVRWRQDLPPAMQLGSDEYDNGPGLYVNMLHLAYNNLLLLLYRSGCIGTADEGREVDGQIALQAAARNSRTIEDMLLEGTLSQAQIHVITNLFNTLCIHTVNLRAFKGAGRSITKHRAKLCLLGLQEPQKTWQVRMWVLQLFFQYLDRSTAAQLRMQDDTGVIPGIYNAQEAKLMQPSRETAGSVSRSGPLMANESDGLDTLLTSETPWSWSTEEANQFLFTQIENDFAFGEGGMHSWNTDTLASVPSVMDTPTLVDL
ncbi:hypothetical protein LX36DRAFT_693007 [Colletotrichum falcatum]|nr:hypothetical protein LX36DRAFT_693007 [Colletotrichum falcatum]